MYGGRDATIKIRVVMPWVEYIGGLNINIPTHEICELTFLQL